MSVIPTDEFLDALVHTMAAHLDIEIDTKEGAETAGFDLGDLSEVLDELACLRPRQT